MTEEKIKLTPEIEQLTEKLLADPKSRVFAQLADAYRKCGMLDEAIETARKGLEIHPQYAVAHLVLGRCYLAKKMYALAREEFELTVKNDPQSLVGFKLLAETYERQSMYPEAVKYYQMVMDLDPTNIDVIEKIESLRKYIKPELPEHPAPVWTREPEPAAMKPEPTSETAAVPSESQAQTEPIQPETEPVLTVTSEEAEPQPLETTSITIEPQEEKEKEVQPEATATVYEEAGLVRSTVTLAELYASQGHLDQAIDAYRELIAAEPQNQSYKDRLNQLLAQAFPEESALVEEGERPSVDNERASEAQAMELTGLFAEMERAVSQRPSESEIAVTQPSPGNLDTIQPMVESAPQPLPETQIMDLGAPSLDKTTAQEEQTEKPKETIVSQTSAVECEEPKEDAVSSFQAWLRSIQG